MIILLLSAMLVKTGKEELVAVAMRTPLQIKWPISGAVMERIPTTSDLQTSQANIKGHLCQNRTATGMSLK